MVRERLPIDRLPLIITPTTHIGGLSPPPFGQSLDVIRSPVNPRRYPEAGQLLLAQETPTVFIPLTEDATEGQIYGALRFWQHLEPGDAFKKNVVTVVTDGPQRIIESSQAFNNRPVIPAGLLDNIIHMEELQKYGVTGDLGTQLGGLYIRALVFDRIVRARVLGQMSDWDIWYPKYPKTYSKQPVHLAQALSDTPNAFYAQIVTPEDINAGVSIFPKREIAAKGTSDRPIGGIIYSAFTRDDLWPTHRIMGRREFFENIPLSTGEYTQNLLTVLAAIEFATAYGLPIAKVFEQAGLQSSELEPSGQMASDYTEVLNVLGDVLFANGKRLIDAKPEDFWEINTRLTLLNNSRLGQILPSLRHMTQKKGILNLEKLARVQRELYTRYWPAFPESLLKILPANLRQPDSPDPDDLIKVTTQMVQTNPRDQTNDIGDDDKLATGTRIVPQGERETHLMESQRATSVFIQQRAALRELYLFNPKRYHPDAYEVRHFFAQGEQLIKDTDIVALEPMHREPKTGRPVADYLRQSFPADRFITGSNDQETLDTFEGFDGLVVHQDTVLSFIARRSLQETGVTPWNAQLQEGRITRLIKNTKGDTVKALFLAGLALGIIQPETQVMLVDSDWENVKGLERYAPVQYLAGTLANQPPDKNFIMTILARIGKERRNQVVLNALNSWSNTNGFQRLVSDNMRKIIWFLSGERVIPAKMLLNHPFPNGYSMEIWLDLLTSLLDIRDPKQTIAQVGTPTKKTLSDSLPSKDWAMTMFCANIFNDMMAFWKTLLDERFSALTVEEQIRFKKDHDAYVQWEINQEDLMPTNWNSQVLTRYNHENGGMPMVLTTPSDAELDPQNAVTAPDQDWRNIDYIFSRDVLEPSITELDNLGLIDWEGLIKYLSEDLGIKVDQKKLENAWWKQRQRERQQTQSAV